MKHAGALAITTLLASLAPAPLWAQATYYVSGERSVIPVPGQQLGVTLRGTDEFLEDLVAASGHLGLEALLPAVGREVLHAGARL